MKGIDVAVHELDQMPNGPSIQSELAAMTGQKTVPNVWVAGKFLGGNDDTQHAAASGKLKEILEEM
jgi:glutaredoxin-related protein